MLSRKARAAIMALAGGVFGVTAAFAQDMPPTVLPVPSAPGAAPPAQAAPAPIIPPAPQMLSQAQLDQLVAPIALYPDPLLGQVLMASTYPLEVTEAAHWTRVPVNRTLDGASLTAALRSKDWDPSVMSLVPFPAMLAVMAGKLEWTDQLGAAFLAQQQDVMAAVQRLRHAALAAGNLKAMPECHCIIQTSADVVSIQPADAELVSVPVYNPTLAFGTWPDAGHPPITLPQSTGFAFAPGVVIGFEPAVEVALYGRLWGWGAIDWPGHRIAVDKARYEAVAPGRPAFADGTWTHDATPRRATAFNVPAVVHHVAVRHPMTPRVRRVAWTHPPRPYWMSLHRASGLPPGTIVPPPPPPVHAAAFWPDYRHY
jgi:hypothetical protein